jgi:NADP-dependent 3-hydroxy acid dehydrogenase YdfG
VYGARVTKHYQRVLITGASSGIGRSMAMWWAKRGATVWATGRRTAMLEGLAREANGQVRPVAMDVTKPRETVARIQEIDHACGGLDLVVANAGVSDATPATLASWDELAQVIKVNVHGAAATLTAVAPLMYARGHGHLVGVSSIAAYNGLGAYSAYCGSKAFFSMFLESMRVDLYGSGVKVTCIEPGFVESEMTARVKGAVPMPFKLATDRAVEKFCAAIVRGDAVCAYPKVYAWSGRAATAVPRGIYEPIAQWIARPLVERFQAQRGESK